MEETTGRKQNIYFLIRCAVLLLILLISCGGAHYVLMPKDDFGAGSMIHFYAQPKNQIDVLAVGTSLTYSGLNTNVLWSNWGISAYDLASAEQPYWNTYYYIEEALKYQQPKVIVLDAKATTYPTGETQLARAIQSTCGIRSLSTRFAALKATAPQDELMNYILFFPQNHEKWKTLQAEDFTPPNQSCDRPIYWKGYIEKEETEPHQKPSLVWTSIKKNLNEREEAYFLKICDLCAEKGIPLLIVAYPNPDYANDHMYYNALWALADERGIPHINLNDPEGHYRFLYSSEFADWQHVNISGSLKVSKILGAYLVEHYDLPDHRGDQAYDSWDVCLSHWMTDWPQYAELISVE